MTALLAIDAATGPCSVAVLVRGEIAAHRREERSIHQARRLVPMIEEALAEAGIGYAALEKIISTVGPGSFTGLRVGLATARAIGLALAKPVQGVSTLYCLAASAFAGQPSIKNIVTVLNAGKGEVYAQVFSRHDNAVLPEGKAGLARPAQVMELLLPGALIAGNVELFSGVTEAPLLALSPDAAYAALMANSGTQEWLLPPEPLYIRPPDAKPQAAPLHRDAEGV